MRFQKRIGKSSMNEKKKQYNLHDLRFSMAFNIIGAIIALLIVFGIIVSTIGFISFSNSFRKEYATTTYHMADTATALVNGDHLDEYLAGGETEEYLSTKQYLDVYCRRMSVSLVYVIRVDTSDYGRFESVFNSVNNSVDNSTYTEWELGHRRDATNDEYREKYRKIYEQTVPYETVYRTNPKDGSHPHITTMVPVKGSDGRTTGILCVQRPMRELYLARRPYLLNIVFWAALLCIGAGVGATVYLRRQFVRPVQKVADEATRFAKENVKGEPIGEISNLSEIKKLARSIDTMESDMVSYIDNLTAATAERERMGTELSLAASIQEASIPNDFPAFPDRNDFDIYASMIPAKEVGGDFYNFFLIDDDHLMIVIGDVSGKGVPGALFMMVTNILISDRAYLGGSPGEILTAVNRDICAHNQAEMFVTIWLGILELSTGRIVAANAGHDDAAICRKDGSFELFKTRHGFVLGGMEGIRYREFEIRLEPGDKLFLYTDGVPEATDADNGMFGMQRTLDALNRNRVKTPQEILDGVHESVNAFVGDAPQFDDLTMLCLEYRGIPERRNVRELTVDATPENIATVTEFVNAALEELNCPAKTQMQIAVAIDELFGNIARYAYAPDTGAATVRVEAETDPRAVTITFIDRGKPYDPLSAEEPDIRASAEERKIGGLGIFIVKKTMDEMRYEFCDGQNVLRVKKYLESEKGRIEA